jgi:alginate O-acetyltransferase complex protein AlgI
MLFNSVQFFIFFSIVVTLYFFIPTKWHWLFLLLASCYFYMAFAPGYIFVLFAMIAIDYFAGILIEDSEGKARKTGLTFSILATCTLLFFFKYFNFFNSNVSDLAKLLHWNYSPLLLKIVLPIGLSFHTFQSLSYVIEVYRGTVKAERHFGIYALYVMFFPQLVAGPIERPQNLIHQFYEHHHFEYERITAGLKLVIWGLFKKAVIADRLAYFVNQVYGNTHDYHGLALIVATVLFSFQIFCDFSGYSDMARGIARVLGFKLMVNFNRPYFSKSISEFWKRWHISLSSWFRDYIYTSLGGNQKGRMLWYVNLLIVFFISGLWHGANWTFIFWGAINGFYLLFSIWTKEIRRQIVHAIGLDKIPQLYSGIKVGITFLLITFAWIFFRANNLSDAFYIVTHLFQGLNDPNMVYQVVHGFGFGSQSILLALASIVLMECVHLIQHYEDIQFIFSKKPKFLRFSIYTAMILGILIFGDFSMRQFIYFQF